MSKLISRQKLLILFAISAACGVATPTASAAPLSRLLADSDLLSMLSPSAVVDLRVPATAHPAVSTTASSQAVDMVDEAADEHAALIALAMELRDIRYRRGGRSPSSGFDCSGFVRYVFEHSVGLILPATSASQFLSGIKVARNDMRSGDLVFFRTAGKKRISHVGIYLDDGRFIHAPSSGKVVRIDRLDETYWAKRFAGAKRPDGVALG